jgi:hypothetical protein
MELDQTENASGIKWLLGAGAAAIALALFAWRVDEYMVNAPARDRAHSAQMEELRTAQTSLPARADDNRQLLPLTIEAVSPQGSSSHSAEHGS